MLPYLLDLVARLGHWSYLIIFVAATLESAAFAGLVVPGESLVLASGFFAHQWLLHFGSRLGLRPEHLARADAFFARQGGKAVLLGRFIGFARALVPFVAGASRMPYRVFLLYNAVGAVLWTISFVLLGYFLGASWQVAEHWIGRTSTVLVGATALAVLVSWIWRRRARCKAAWRC